MPSPSSPWSSFGSRVISGQESLVVDAIAVTSQPATICELVVVQPAELEPVQETKKLVTEDLVQELVEDGSGSLGLPPPPPPPSDR